MGVIVCLFGVNYSEHCTLIVNSIVSVYCFLALFPDGNKAFIFLEESK